MLFCQDEGQFLTGNDSVLPAHFLCSALSFVILCARRFSNGGYSFDLSRGVLERALLHVDNAYKWPALHTTGRICRTNLPTNTAFRGFGGPQGTAFSTLFNVIACSALTFIIALTCGRLWNTHLIDAAFVCLLLFTCVRHACR